MPHEKLENLVRARTLKAEPAEAEEIAGLVRSGLVRLKDAGNTSLGIESRFDLAYNAAHALSLAALRLYGYIARIRDMSCSSVCNTPSIFQVSSGECWIKLTGNGISVNTRVIWMWMSRSWKH